MLATQVVLWETRNMEPNPMLEEAWRIKDELARDAALERSRVLVLCMSANAFDSDWAQLQAGTFRFRDPLNKQRRFLPLRL